MRGMTLIEVIIAGTMLIAGITGIFSAWNNLSALMEHERRISTANQVLMTQADALLLLNPGSSRLAAGSYTVGNADVFGNLASTSSSASYTVTYTVTDNTPIRGFVRIKLTATWQESRGTKSSTITFSRER